LDASGADRTIPVEVVGIDGAPFADEFGRPRSQTSAEPIVLPTGGRIEFKVKLGGDVTLQRVVLRTEAVESGCAGDLMPARDLVAVRIDPAADSPASTMPSMQSPVAAAQQTSSRFSDVTPLDFAARRRTFAFTEYQRPLSSKTDFYITEVSRPDVVIEPYPMHGMPSSVVEVQAGAVEEWTILNFTHEIHSFHIHQIHFRVLESDVKFLEHRMLDTINVPPAMPDANWSADDPVTPGRVRLLMRFHRNIAGMFVFHCHILSHEDKGMMGLIRVLDTSSGQSDRLEQMRGMEHLH
jgi:FtsP/CotA-like multicopper oxidase with cupredoxin domain